MTDHQLPDISAVEAVGALAQDAPPILIDMRKAAALRDAPTLTFCIHGDDVSHFARARARTHWVAARYAACYIVGGFEALVAAGARVEALA